MSGQTAAALPFGATLAPGGRQTRFRLWAPAQRRIELELDDGRRILMQAGTGGWHERVVDCGAGTGYRYVLEDGTAVPDPASRAQADDVHGYSLVVDPEAYQWCHREWRGRPWTEAVLYELHVGLFGGYEGVTRELPRLAALGITAVELMPLNDFPGRRNWGYDGVLPYAPDRAYGTPTELKALIDAAHGLNLMVFLDVVYNHFGPDGNFLHAYAPQFFRDDAPTAWGPAIDFERPEVREFFTHNVLYWLREYRFDGLRFDAVHAIRESDWLDETARTARAALPDREVHLVLENEANSAHHLERTPAGGFDAQWNDDGHHALHVLLTGEREGYYRNFAEDPAAQLARCLAEGFVYQGEHSPTHGHARGTPSGHLPPHAFVLFLQNHDQIGNRACGERLTTLARADALDAALALVLLCPQIPMLFMGEEWGSARPFLFFTDHHDQLADAVREGRRNEFKHFAAFADPAARARIPDPNAEATYEASRPDFEAAAGAGAERLKRVERLLALRREQLVPGLSDARSLGAAKIGPAAVRAQWRLGGGRLLTLAANFGDAELPCAPPPQSRCIWPDPAATGNALPPRSTLAWIGAAP